MAIRLRFFSTDNGRLCSAQPTLRSRPTSPRACYFENEETVSHLLVLFRLYERFELLLTYADILVVDQRIPRGPKFHLSILWL